MNKEGSSLAQYLKKLKMYKSSITKPTVSLIFFNLEIYKKLILAEPSDSKDELKGKPFLVIPSVFSINVLASHFQQGKIHLSTYMLICSVLLHFI